MSKLSNKLQPRLKVLARDLEQPLHLLVLPGCLLLQLCHHRLILHHRIVGEMELQGLHGSGIGEPLEQGFKVYIGDGGDGLQVGEIGGHLGDNSGKVGRDGGWGKVLGLGKSMGGGN